MYTYYIYCIHIIYLLYKYYLYIYIILILYINSAYIYNIHMLNHISRYTCTGCHQVAPAPGSARWSRGRDAGRTKDFGSNPRP